MTWQSHPLPDHKTALVLAGGGVTGAVYELGALKALNEMLAPSGRTANDFDIYVGTSAGAILGSVLANGLSVETLCQLLADQHPAVRGLRHGDVFRWNSRGLARWALGMPGRLARAAGRSLRQHSLTPLLMALSEAAPPGLYDGAGLADYLRQVVLALGGTDSFDDLPRDLHVVATSLNTGERAVFGRGQSEASISQAVAASTALPFLYAPVQVGEGWYVDGGLRGNASVDVAIEQGARLVVCINPLVPQAVGADTDAERSVAWRTMRIASHAGLHYHLKHLRQRHPEVDILLIEPRADDADFLNVPMMDFGARQALLAHGCQAVRQHLSEHYAHFAAVFARHGLRLRLPEGLAHAERETLAAQGPTTASPLEPAEAPAWPNRARPGHTGAQAHTRPRPPATLPQGLPLSPKGDSQTA